MRRSHLPIVALIALLASLVIVPAAFAVSVSASATHAAHPTKRTSTHRTRPKGTRKSASSATAKRTHTVKVTERTKTVKAPKGRATTKASGASRTATNLAATASRTVTYAAVPATALTSAAASAPAQTASAIATPVAASASSSTPAASSASSTTPATTSAAASAPAASTAAATSAATTSSSTPVLGTFDISTPAQASAWKSAGGNAVIIPVYWDQAQPTQTGGVSLASAGNSGDSVISEIQTAHQDGLAVYLELDLQYPPQWVLNGVPEFVDQGGNSWVQSTTPGADVRDWIWTAVGRQDVSSFVSGALSDLAPYLSDVAGFRAGGGVYGELDFPNDGSTVNNQPSFWGYDAAAQTGTGLAAGESATPLPGYVYGSGTAAQDAEWSHWYLGSLASWIKWYTQLLRSDGWTGPTYVLSPSFGMRTNMTPYSTPYEQQLAWGTDWGVMMDSYDQVSNVWPWSTWADDTEPYWHTGDTVDSDAAAWRKLLELAQARGLASHIMGENSGGGGAAAIHQLMSGALASGYTGVFYLDYPTLTETGLTTYLVSQYDTYAD